jgi:hypothetical protein
VEDPTFPGIYLEIGIIIFGAILIVYELRDSNNRKDKL